MEQNVTMHPSMLGIELAMPEWEAILTAIVLFIVIVLTIIGNVLVIICVFTCKQLRKAQNVFIVSLAVSDLTVAIFVLPLNVVYTILGRWVLGIHACKMWLTSDILCCSASILNLCAISLDRYWAISDPINYALQRTLKRVLTMIGGVWVLSAIISSPPLFGWNDWPQPANWTSETLCVLTDKQGFVIYSSLGSFYIPLFIMVTVYLEIFIATRRRLRKRTLTSRQYLEKNAQKKVSTLPVRRMSDTSQTSTVDNICPTPNDSTIEEAASRNENVITKTKSKKQKVQINEESYNEIDESSTGLGESSTNELEIAGECSMRPCSLEDKPTQLNLFHTEKHKISLSKERKAARTLGVIMGVFVICWLPFFIQYVIPGELRKGLGKKSQDLIIWLGYVNSMLNPIIYTIFSIDFRRTMKKLLCL